jgi:hypothetical protein
MSLSGASTVARVKSAGPGATVLLHPGRVRTDMGGPSAPLDVPTSSRGMADTIASLAVSKGVHYVDYQGKVLPW